MALDADEFLDNLDADGLDEHHNWAVRDGCYYAAPKTAERIEPGVYSIKTSYEKGVYFEPVSLKKEELVRFEDEITDEVVNEIRNFWSRKAVFRQHRIQFKRGIFLYGPPGSGKSVTLQFVMNDVVKEGGIAISNWPGSDLFHAGMMLLRKIQPEIPVVALLEDMDTILGAEKNKNDLLNLLDGVEHIDNIVYLATTNYLDKFPPNIINRPSRFDRKLEVKFPSGRARAVYLRSLLSRSDAKIDFDRWVTDTDGFSVAHLKELFVSVVLMEISYETAMLSVKSMIAEKDK